MATSPTSCGSTPSSTTSSPKAGKQRDPVGHHAHPARAHRPRVRAQHGGARRARTGTSTRKILAAMIDGDEELAALLAMRHVRRAGEAATVLGPTSDGDDRDEAAEFVHPARVPAPAGAADDVVSRVRARHRHERYRAGRALPRPREGRRRDGVGDRLHRPHVGLRRLQHACTRRMGARPRSRPA